MASTATSPAAEAGSKAVAAMREALVAAGADAYYLPHGDEHANEYLSPHHERIAFVSGFTGSAGTVVVTATQTLLWTDGRYYLQAENQLYPGWKLMRSHAELAPGAWLKAEGHTRVASPASTLGHATAARLKAHGCSLALLDDNPVDSVWNASGSRPLPARAPIVPLATTYTGEDAASKIARISAAVHSAGYAAVLVTALDEIAWLLNCRGSDIPYNPVFLSVALVLTPEAKTQLDASHAVTLWLDDPNGCRLDEEGRSSLAAANVNIVPVLNQAHIATALEAAAAAGNVWLDGRTVPMAYASVVECKAQSATSPINDAKSIKNATELEGLRACHLRDGAALTRFMYALESRISAGDTLSECEAAAMLEHERSIEADYVSLSFETISSSGPNGAVIHYAPQAETARVLAADEPYLVDSGGQYLDGTTDVTRCRVFSSPSAHMKRCYTRVLQGHIALATAYLWRDGLDYRHGTGHGVGAYLNVHEGPHLISYRAAANNPPLKAGMTVTNEPGYYEDGAFGFRIENVMLVVPAATPHNFDATDFLAFETITFAPLARDLIDVALLSQAERDWVDAYHQQVLDHLTPRMASDEQRAWLGQACASLGA
ncbi:peptidase [Thecamonas trahens ATCC 50062]|uniref:Peptidase n=1 Tax=Thecamonas trahens ATCC 50062 TaxID=461836 RepID=A0A0L0D1Z9_THETB|nr:peptidase [Thecamonas trahens ATCC 50062]KNC46302.1 peptidase [Thecamonas trahens ATCC 50062]|eukprot:XP_013760595.1 peptidase [Thecamonas trahens ATCC 50062]